MKRFFPPPALWLSPDSPYLETESFLHQPALGDPPGVLRRGDVLDVQLLASVLKNIIAGAAQIRQ